MRPEHPIGVFDSGVGGLSILRALRAALPREDFVYFSDAGHAPYGEKDVAFVRDRTLAIAADLRSLHRVKGLVVACNTATAAAVHLLRERHADLPMVGVEPALKPAAALTRTGRVAVFATRGTLASAKFASLHAALRAEAEFILQPCDGLAAAIEAGDSEAVQSLCARYVRAAGRFGAGPGEIDTLVLGCTHYPFAESVLRGLVGPAVRFVETGEPVARQTLRLLHERGLLNPSGGGRTQWHTSGAPQALAAAAGRWLHQPPGGSNTSSEGNRSRASMQSSR
jgi:glutamate racemase